MTVPATTINKVCLSGLNAIYLADQMIQAGEADIVVAGGMESMTQAPYLLPGARAGYRIGDQKVVDSMMYDGLFCAFDQVRHGRRHREVRRLGRASPASRRTSSPPQSHERAARAAKDGLFDNEIVTVEVPQRKGDPVVFDTDEGVRGETTAESLGRPASRVRQGRQHHRRQRVADLRRRRRGDRRLQGRGREARPARRSARSSATGRSPVPTRRCSPSRRVRSSRPPSRPARRSATSSCSSSTRRSPPSALASMTDLGITDDIVNVNGGAIALGHPVGMSGTRVALTLAPRAGPPRRRPRRRRPLRRRRPGRRHPPRDGVAGLPARHRRDRRDTPRRHGGTSGGTRMFERIVVGTDGSETATRRCARPPSWPLRAPPSSTS